MYTWLILEVCGRSRPIVPAETPLLPQNSGLGSFSHDLTQPVVRAWWIASATNASFFKHFDGVFADNAIANGAQLITADGTRLDGAAGAALLAGQQALYSELRQRLRQVQPGASVIFNGIRVGQGFATIPVRAEPPSVLDS